MDYLRAFYSPLLKKRVSKKNMYSGVCKTFQKNARARRKRGGNMRKTLRNQIKANLLEELNRNGVFSKFYLDIVEDYMSLWDTKNALISDIEKRGAVVPYTSNTGQTNPKKNESVGELLKVNAQMLKILETLNFKPGLVVDDSDEL